MKKIVMIHGAIGAGKDTLGALLSKELIKRQYETHKISFAYKVKQMASLLTGEPLFPLPGDDYSTAAFDFTRDQKQSYMQEWDMTLGEMLQKLATEGVRNVVSRDAWIIALNNELKNDIEVSDKKVYILTDLRFPNEMAWAKADNHFTMKIVRPNLEKEEGRDHNHESERGLPDDDFDLVVNNEGTIEDLQKRAVLIADRLEGIWKL